MSVKSNIAIFIVASITASITFIKSKVAVAVIIKIISIGFIIIMSIRLIVNVITDIIKIISIGLINIVSTRLTVNIITAMN